MKRLLQKLGHNLYRVIFNLYPAYFGSGGKVSFIALDWKKVRVKFKYNWRTRNLQKMAFGGSIYASLDPIIAIQVAHILGKKYIVLDKSAKISYLKPIRKTVYCESNISDHLIARIKQEVSKDHRYCFEDILEYKDEQGVVYARITKEIYVADRSYFLQKSQKTGLSQRE